MIFLIISTNNLIELANSVMKISVDGTFFTVPKFVKGQLFTIFGEFSGKHVPMFFVLMSNSKHLCPGLNPTQCISDFESSSMSSVSEAFPACEVYGCFFPFTKAIRKNRALHSLEKDWMARNQVKQFFGLLMNLPHLPCELIEHLKSCQFS